MKNLLILLSLVFLFSCTGTKMAVRSEIENEKTLSYGFEDVWPAVLEVLADKDMPVGALEKASGFINTKREIFLTREIADVDKDIRKLASVPSRWYAEIITARYSFIFLIKAVDEISTNIKMTTNLDVQYFEDGTWHEAFSNGTIEKEYFDLIESKLKK